MKNSIYLLALLMYPAANPAWACSEAGPHEFDVSADVSSRCAKIAGKYAEVFANAMVNIEEREKGYRGPKGKFKANHPEPVLYTTLSRKGNSKLIGFNVGLDSKNKQECNFCVDMSFDSDGQCRIESIRKQMCVN